MSHSKMNFQDYQK